MCQMHLRPTHGKHTRTHPHPHCTVIPLYELNVFFASKNIFLYSLPLCGPAPLCWHSWLLDGRVDYVYQGRVRLLWIVCCSCFISVWQCHAVRA